MAEKGHSQREEGDGPDIETDRPADPGQGAGRQASLEAAREAGLPGKKEKKAQESRRKGGDKGGRMQEKKKEGPDLEGLERKRCPEKKGREEPGSPHAEKVTPHDLGSSALFRIDHEADQRDEEPEVEKTPPELPRPDCFRKSQKFSQNSHIGHDRNRPRGGVRSFAFGIGDLSDGYSE